MDNEKQTKNTKPTIKQITTTLNSLKSYRQKRLYLQSLGRVERGAGRMCLKLENKVIKVAYNEFGMIQNRREILTWNNATKHYRKYFATIYNYDMFYKTWIVQERLKLPRYIYRWDLIKYESDKWEQVCDIYQLDFWELKNQVGINSKKRVKIFDYGFNVWE